MKYAKSQFKILVLIIFILINTLSYIWADMREGSSYVFSGFLINPKDGYSYLAKMRQGFEGSWKYSFPYSVDGGNGAYLFLYFIFLGHFARIVRWDLIDVYHFMRILNAGILVLILWNFYERVIQEKKHVILAFVLALFGSGLGWISSLIGYQTSDIWVAEAFPFLSSYSNPHFPLSLGIMIWLMTPFRQTSDSNNRQEIKTWIAIAGLAFLLAVVSPFGSIIVIIVTGIVTAWELAEQTRIHKDLTGIRQMVSLAWKSPWLKKLLLISAFSAPVLLYEWSISKIDPIIAGWSAQNLTPSPPIWDFFLSFSPTLLLAIPGGVRVLKEHRKETRTLLVWVLCGLGLIYFPYGLQRRFMLGYFLPVVGLSVLGLGKISRYIPKKSWLVSLLLLLLSLPTNLLILMTANYAGSRHDANLYVSTAEDAALTWLREEVPSEAIILASPQTGLLIPPMTGHRVLYGHPFETIQASYWERVVINCYQGSIDKNILNRVDYIYYGPREKMLGRAFEDSQFPIVFENEEVTIYRNEN